MSQTWNIPMTGGASGDTIAASRQKINDAFDALLTTFKGSSRPAAAVAGTFWVDDSPSGGDILKYYDGSVDVIVFPDLSAAGGGNIKADGTVAFTGNQSMGSNKLTSLANGTAAGDALAKSQVDARAVLAVFRLGDISATGNFPVWFGGPACTLLQVAVVVQTAITANDTNYWSIQLYNQQDAANVLAAARETTISGGGFSALTTEDLGAFASGKDALDADDVLQIQLTKNGSAANLDELAFAARFKIST